MSLGRFACAAHAAIDVLEQQGQFGANLAENFAMRQSFGVDDGDTKKKRVFNEGLLRQGCDLQSDREDNLVS